MSIPASDCDYTFHSRRKTANHARFEGARRPEDIAALAAEAAAEAAAAAAAAELSAKAQLEELEAESPPQRTANAKGAASTYAAAAGKGVQAAASTTAAAKPKTTPQAASSAASSASSSQKQANLSAAAAASQKQANPAAVAAARTATEDDDQDESTQEDRAAEHRAAWDERRRALCKNKYNVGHWLGLTTDDRKELACALCQELLFNPQPSATAKATVAVEWSVQSYWTTYSIDVVCSVTTTFVSKKKKNPSVTTYKVHVDDHGKLAEFDVDIDGVASSQCVVM